MRVLLRDRRCVAPIVLRLAWELVTKFLAAPGMLQVTGLRIH